MRSIPHYIRKSTATIVRSYTMYRPMRVFVALGAALILGGIVPGIRFLYLFGTGHRVGHIQSLILAAILIIVGFQVLLIGLLADLLSCNRKLLEDVLYRVRKMEVRGIAPRREIRNESRMTPQVAIQQPAAPAAPKPKFWRSPYLRIGGSLLILALLIAFLPSRQLWTTMKRIPPGMGIALLFGYLALHLLGVIKWRLLINTAGAGLSFSESVRCYYVGLFGNIFLPSLVGGDFVRAAAAFRSSRSKPAIVLGSLFDRVQDVVALAAVAAFGALFLPRALDPHSRRVFWVIGAMLAVGGAAGLASLFVIPARKFPFKLRRIMVKVRRGMFSMYRRPGRMMTGLFLGICLQVFQVVINSWLGNLAGLSSVGFGMWLFAWPLAKLSALAPFTQGGIGVREVALVGLLSPFGAPPVLTAAVGLTFQAIVITGGLIGGLFAFLIGRFSSSPEGSSTL